MQLTIKIILVLLFLQISNVNGADVDSESKYIELSTDIWVLSLPESWKPEAIKGGVRVNSGDEVFSIYVTTYNVDTPLSGWAQRDIAMVKDSKHSDPVNDFKYMQETIELDSDSDIQHFVLDAYDEKSSFRIYTKHFRMGNKLVTLSIHDYWCQSYKKSVNFTEDLLKGFEIKT
ncbi:hypothetical protein [Colwellia psychrerythraea]|uniref:PsbP C-terminal domain-containing protein n=1 Tax=Colwellia psychrerythraea TaxID=28229 RepID=A0A099KUE8_COLPS|nr:hypothetical protein [Colwellia psychrerythraea]KGJ93283.1 hypothetical protein GAB14E_2689 [Colwellia psychrerythraea]